MLAFVVVVALASVVIGSDFARIVDQTLDHEVDEGLNIHLQCNVFIGKRHKDLVVRWSRVTLGQPNSEEIVSENGRLYGDASRRKFDAEKIPWPDNPLVEHSMKVVDARKRDSGKYTCSVVDSSGHIVAFNSTIVSVVPENATDVAEKTPGGGKFGPVTAIYVLRRDGVDVMLECREKDAPEIGAEESVLWKKVADEEHTTVGTGRQLKLLKMDSWNNGIYYCLSNSSNSQPRLSKNVKKAPALSSPGSIYKPKASRLVAYRQTGQEAKINCKVNASPPPVISWYRIFPGNSRTIRRPTMKQLKTNDDYEKVISLYNPKEEVIMHTLVIHKLDEDDFGDYMCVAKNQVGEASMEIQLARLSQSPIGISSSTCGLLRGWPSFILFVTLITSNKLF